MRLKSFFFSTILTTLLSVMVFFLLVFLGMKYHWVEVFNKSSQQLTELTIPQVSEKDAFASDPQIVSTAVDSYSKTDKTEIIETDKSSSPLANMTKQQVLEYCQKRFKTQGFSEDAIIVAVGNCVVNNYQEPYEEIEPKNLHSARQTTIQAVKYMGSAVAQRQSVQNNKPKKNSRQAKVYQDAIRHRCTFEMNKQGLLSVHEKQLLIETCVNDLSHR